MPYGDGIPKKAGEWDWHGKNDPAWSAPAEGVTTFTINVFRWKRKKTGQDGDTKRGRGEAHFTASITEPQKAYDQALAFIRAKQS